MTCLVVETEEIDAPADLLARLARPDGIAWLHGGDGFVAFGEAARIEVRGGGRFDEARRAFLEVAHNAQVRDGIGVAGTGPVAFGAFTFDAGSRGSALVIPAVVVARREGRAWITRTGGAPDEVREWTNDRVRYAGSSIPEIEWLEAVERAAEAVRLRAAEKVVLARDVHVWSKVAFDLRPVTRLLATTFPECYTFLFDGLVGASPELLARRMGESIESLVLAGTAARGATPEEDEAIGNALLHSVKDGAEHRPAMEYVRRCLAGISEDLKVTPEPFLLRLANVQHLATAFAGRLTGGPDALGIAALLHPTPAVCGTPAARAMELIRRLERMDRGRYAGPVGWMDGRGDGEWAIALRCAEFDGPRGRLFAGAGIVGASVPESELEETRVKLWAMQAALDGAILEPGRVFETRR